MTTYRINTEHARQQDAADRRDRALDAAHDAIYDAVINGQDINVGSRVVMADDVWVDWDMLCSARRAAAAGNDNQAVLIMLEAMHVAARVAADAYAADLVTYGAALRAERIAEDAHDNREDL